MTVTIVSGILRGYFWTIFGHSGLSTVFFSVLNNYFLRISGMLKVYVPFLFLAFDTYLSVEIVILLL